MASPAQIANFKKAYDAFNDMASISKDKSPLHNVLHPNVRVYRVSDDSVWQSGRDKVIDSFYGLVKNGKGPKFDPNYNGALPDFSKPNKVKGRGAQWIDTDGSDSDDLTYTFTFNGDLLSELRARDV